MHSSSVLSVIAPVHASSIPSINPSDVKSQEIPEEFASANYGEKFLVEIMAKIPDNATLTLTKENFLEKTHGYYNGGNYSVEFLSG